MKRLTKTAVITASALMAGGLILSSVGSVMGGDMLGAFADQGFRAEFSTDSGVKDKKKNDTLPERGGNDRGAYRRGYGSDDMDDFFKDFFGDDMDIFGDFFNDGMGGYDDGGRNNDVVYF